MKLPETTITICMGSSCFSRGNNISAEIIEQFLRDNDLSGKVEVQGCLCDNHCKNGPNIRINGELIQGVQPEMICDLLKHKLIGGKK